MARSLARLATAACRAHSMLTCPRPRAVFAKYRGKTLAAKKPHRPEPSQSLIGVRLSVPFSCHYPKLPFKTICGSSTEGHLISHARPASSFAPPAWRWHWRSPVIHSKSMGEVREPPGKVGLTENNLKIHGNTVMRLTFQRLPNQRSAWCTTRLIFPRGILGDWQGSGRRERR